MGCLSAKKLENTFKTFISANELEPSDAAYVAAEKIKKAHQARLAGESSPGECDQVVRGVLAA